ncbi:MAG: HIT domain-containing protein [Pseudomonadota bacterium]|nr:HIT domain-containing protein [Pseudomonadota bacterium]
MTDEFHLHPRLAADTVFVGDWPLCRVLLMDDAQYPWAILVPRRVDLREAYQLDPADQLQLLAESNHLGREMMQAFSGEKLNVAALGNMVPQLHVHHVVRNSSDPSWPAPVWGKLPAIGYGDAELAQRMRQMQSIHQALASTN